MLQKRYGFFGWMLTGYIQLAVLLTLSFTAWKVIRYAC